MTSTNWNVRTELLLGDDNVEKLRKAHVLVIGLGGVGAAAAEMICRSGIGKMTIIDTDVVEASNKNRQLGALTSTDGMQKAEAVGNRLKDINPDLEIKMIVQYLKDEEIVELLNSEKFSYVMDCIDTLAPKVYLIYHCVKNKIPLISSMGAGGKIDPSQVKIGDISESLNCKLARYVRKRLHRLGVYKGVKVVYSTEFIDRTRVVVKENMQNKRSVIGTISYLPPIFGCFAASVVIRDLIGKTVKTRPIKHWYPRDMF